MSELLQNPISLVLLLAAIIAVIFYLREYNKRRKLESEGSRFLEDLKEKGWEALHESIKKSEDILGQAELEEIKVAAGSKLKMSKMEAEYAKQLSASLDVSRQNINLAQAKLLEFMQDLQKSSEAFEEASKSAGEQRINRLFEKLELKLSDFLIQTEQKTTSSIELELKSTRQLIDTYKNTQLKLIDENIIAILEQTLNIVLAKKLSLKDQLDLIYEALEKAKVEKFIV